MNRNVIRVFAIAVGIPIAALASFVAYQIVPVVIEHVVPQVVRSVTGA